jgi:hypothetical protein
MFVDGYTWLVKDSILPRQSLGRRLAFIFNPQSITFTFPWPLDAFLPRPYC